MHCSYLSVSSLCITIDHGEYGREEPPEPAPVEDANPEQDQGKPRCIYLYSWSFTYLCILFMVSECALGYRS
jgi:hypothetical protein